MSEKKWSCRSCTYENEYTQLLSCSICSTSKIVTNESNTNSKSQCLPEVIDLFDSEDDVDAQPKKRMRSMRTGIGIGIRTSIYQNQENKMNMSYTGNNNPRQRPVSVSPMTRMMNEIVRGWEICTNA